MCAQAATDEEPEFNRGRVFDNPAARSGDRRLSV
jgi:hypothetical protein